VKKPNDSDKPSWPFRFLEVFCPPALYEGIAGDIEESFEATRNKSGKAKSKY
jgi:hypothetical protein